MAHNKMHFPLTGLGPHLNKITRHQGQLTGLLFQVPTLTDGLVDAESGSVFRFFCL